MSEFSDTWDERHHRNSACLLPGSSRFCQRSLLNKVMPRSVLNQGCCQIRKEVTHVWQEVAWGKGQVSPSLTLLYCLSKSSSSWNPSARKAKNGWFSITRIVMFSFSEHTIVSHNTTCLSTTLDFLAVWGSCLFSLTGPDARWRRFRWFSAAASACSLLHATAGRHGRGLHLPGLHLLSSSNRPTGTTQTAAGWDEQKAGRVKELIRSVLTLIKLSRCSHRNNLLLYRS